MLRIANMYESRLGRNDGNPLFLTVALKRRQEKGLLKIDHVAPTGDLEILGHYSAFLWADWGEDGLRHVLPYAPVFPVKNGVDPIVYWPTDTHVDGASYDYRLHLARQSDIVFTAQKITVEQFKKDGVEATWLPCAVEPQAYPTFERASKHYDVCFIGHINSEHRIDFLDRMFREFPNFFYGQKLFEEAAEVYSDSKICLNVALNNDINMRCFEVMGSRNFLLTSRVDGLEDLFVDGKHCVMFDSFDDAVRKAKYYLEHEDERNYIAQAGYEEVMKKHTFEHRVDTILEAINNFKNNLVKNA